MDLAWRATWVPRLGEEGEISLNLDVLGSGQVLEVESPSISTYLTGRSGSPLLDRKTPFLSPGQRTRALAVAPGGRVIIVGESLADSRVQSANGATRLGNTRVTLGGVEMLLMSVSPTEIEAVVPQGLKFNVAQVLIVARGTELSAPERLAVAESWPTVVEAGNAAGGRGAVDLLITSVRPSDLGRTILTVNGNSCTLSQIEPVRNEPGLFYGRAVGCHAREGARIELSTSSSKTSDAAVRGQAGAVVVEAR